MQDNTFNWFKCPKCEKTLFRLFDKSVIRGEVFCPRCKTTYDVDIVGLKIIDTKVKATVLH